jgi:hypothetical protein
MKDGSKKEEDKIVSVRFKMPQYNSLVSEAEVAGFNVSELVRLKALENPANGIREMILLLRDIGVSNLAHNNLILDVMGVTLDTRGPLINDYKIKLMKLINGDENA